MSDKLISIVIPNYNSSKYIEQTIDSIKKQSYKNWELIIVDDCSTDNSYELIKKIIKENNRISLHKLKENTGAYAARNHGIKLAKGHFLCFQDSDDLWKENFLLNSYKHICKLNCPVVYCGYERLDEELKPYISDFIGPEEVTYKSIMYNCPIAVTTALIDLSKVGKIYFPNIDKREDHGFWIRVLEKVNIIYGRNQVDVIYRMRKESVSRNKLEIAKKQYAVYKKFMRFSTLKSLYYTFCWAINGLKKYGRTSI